VKIQDKLRILHVTPFYPPSIGGISNLVFNICKELSKFNHDIHIITSRNIMNHDNYEERKSDKITEIKSIHFPGWPYSTLRNFSFPADMGFKINSIIKHDIFDVVHVHGHHYPLCWIALHSAHKNKIPTVLSLHGTYALDPTKVGGQSTIEDLFNKYIFKKILLKSDFVIGGTNQNIEYTRKYSSSYNRFRIIPPGVDSTKYKTNLDRKKEYREKFKISQTKIVLLFVGRFDDSKGALNFAKASELLMRKHENKFEVIMVGRGKLGDKVRSIAQGVEGIQILDWQPAENIHEIYIASDVFILPSKFEALPLSIMEAMAANLYIIYSNVGGVNEILQGYCKKNMLNSVTPEAISHACLTLYDLGIIKINSDSTSYTFSFDWKDTARRINDVYNEMG
jgi:glycosyltransferase involved in cell wall biosynthesis